MWIALFGVIAPRQKAKASNGITHPHQDFVNSQKFRFMFISSGYCSSMLQEQDEIDCVLWMSSNQHLKTVDLCCRFNIFLTISTVCCDYQMKWSRIFFDTMISWPTSEAAVFFNDSLMWMPPQRSWILTFQVFIFDNQKWSCDLLLAAIHIKRKEAVDGGV